jgi:hypothetical protein
MQQEDDLRGLAKVMEFMRAVSILFCGGDFFVESPMSTRLPSGYF